MRRLLQLPTGLLKLLAGIVAGFVVGVGFSFALNEAIAAWPTRDVRLAPVDVGSPDGVASYEITQGGVLWRVSCRDACDRIVSRLGAPVWRVRAIDRDGRNLEDRRLAFLSHAPNATWRRSEGAGLVLWERKQ